MALSFDLALTAICHDNRGEGGCGVDVEGQSEDMGQKDKDVKVEIDVAYAVQHMDPLLQLLWGYTASGKSGGVVQDQGAVQQDQVITGTFLSVVAVRRPSEPEFETQLHVGEGVGRALRTKFNHKMPFKCCVGESVPLTFRIRRGASPAGADQEKNSIAKEENTQIPEALEYRLLVVDGGGWLLAGRTTGFLKPTSFSSSSTEWEGRCWMVATLCGRLPLPVLSLPGVAQQGVWDKTADVRVLVVESLD